MVIQPLIDADILCYELGFVTQYNGEDGLPYSVDVEEINHTLDKRIENILQELRDCFYEPDIEWLTPKFYLTGKGNFRFDVAKSKPYKGNRLQPKPINYTYIRSYLEHIYNAIIVDGIEADDAMRIESVALSDTDVTPVICSRDKDLFQSKGWVFSWESHNQAQRFVFVDGIGSLELNEKRKLKGHGDKFLYSQILIGDKTDNYDGCPKIGDVKAYNLLKDCETLEVIFKV